MINSIGAPPDARIDGTLTPISDSPMESARCRELVLAVLTETERARLNGFFGKRAHFREIFLGRGLAPCAAFAHRQGHSSTDERCKGKDRTRTGRAESALRQQVNAQAQTVACGADGQQGRGRGRVDSHGARRGGRARRGRTEGGARAS